MTDPVRCWALSPLGRCDKEAGHNGDHALLFLWEDDDSVTLTGGPAVRWAGPLETEGQEA